LIRLATRSRISFADLLVKVIAAMRLAGYRPVCTRCAIFSTITRVLPLPAPASTSMGPSTWATAADCWGLRPCIAGLREAAGHSTRAASRPVLTRAARAPPSQPFPARSQKRAGPGARIPPMAKLYFYYSAMNAGKTTTLLQSAHNYRERGMRTLIMTPRLDHRDGSGMVASRIGLRAEGVAFGRDDDLQALVERDIAAHGRLHCLLIDEAPCLARAQVWQLGEVVDALGVPVLCYGLRTDFRGELFEGSQYLLAWADEISEIKTICHSGSKATMTVRVDASGRAVSEGPQVEIGGNERYVSVSRAEVKRIMRGAGTIEPLQPSLPLD